MAIAQDVLDYFLHPKKTGYDFPKTLVYAALFVLAIYVIFKLLKKMKIKVDKRLAIAISPYIVLGGALRVIQDIGLVSSYFFVTPGIYVFVFFITLLVLLSSLFLEKKKGVPYFKTMFMAGLLLMAFTIVHIEPINPQSSLLILVFLIPWAVLLNKVKWTTENKLVTLIQLFDGTATFVALNFFGYYEQHIIPTFIINLFGPISFIFIKLITVVAILVLIDRISPDKEFNNYLKLIIGILGGATGSRDFLALIALA